MRDVAKCYQRNKKKTHILYATITSHRNKMVSKTRQYPTTSTHTDIMLRFLYRLIVFPSIFGFPVLDLRLNNFKINAWRCLVTLKLSNLSFLQHNILNSYKCFMYKVDD
ncbi:hypothetical protein QTP88_024282 [Uroleucon formosanum]